MKKIVYLLIIALAGIMSSCSKKDKQTNGDGPSKVGSTLDLIRDSVFLYAKEEYYWNTSLPTYAQFNPRGFTATADIDALTNEVNALSQYAINPATNQPYEYYAPNPGEAKYSFIDNGQVSTQLNGVHGDFGFAPLYNTISDLRIKYVYPGSPADIAGIKRGYQITTINGNSNFPYDGGSGTNTQFVINAYAYSNSISMTLKKPDGTTMNATLNVANYTVNPVLTYKVYDQGNGHKAGYMVFNSFTSLANAQPQINTAFNYFVANGVTDLVVDLRYNGGGYIETAEYLDNLIVPAAKNGTLMYNTYYNSILAANKETLLANQTRRDPNTGQDYNYAQFDYSVASYTVNFAKVGTLNVNRVFFIVTGSTASASELTINNLLPEFPASSVFLIGTTSYGKPVGFFDIDINQYQLYIPEFATMNSANQGGYYAGMTPGTTTYPGVMDYDDVTKDFGDPTEVLLAHALNYVKLGTFSVQSQQAQTNIGPTGFRSFSISQFNTAAVQLDHHQFNGMLFKNLNRHLRRKK
jgi:carboxyl-terminal processing protease